MNSELAILLGSAATLGLTHTAIGLDHTLPFILLGRARAWSLPKTLLITGACGVAHVASSVVIGLLGVTLAVALTSLEWFEAARGYWVGWALVAFGTAYALFSLVKLRRITSHRHIHVHADGSIHRHQHGHGGATDLSRQHHSVDGGGYPRRDPLRQSNVLGSLFIVFLLGPCEALLPLMTAPGLQSNTNASLLVAAVFGGATLTTMLGMVAAGWFGMRGVRWTRWEPHLNWISGVTIALSGLGIQFLGL